MYFMAYYEWLHTNFFLYLFLSLRLHATYLPGYVHTVNQLKRIYWMH